MNEQDRAMRLKRAKCNTLMGITSITAKNGPEEGVKLLKKMRTELAAEIQNMPGISHLTTYVIDGRWFLTGDGDVHEIVSPPAKTIPQGRYVLHTEDFLRFAGIKAFSGRPIA